MKPANRDNALQWRKTALPCILLALALFAGCASSPESTTREENQPVFDQLLEEAGLTLDNTALAIDPLRENALLSSLACDQRLQIQAGQMYLCVMIRPLSRMQIDYEDPHNSAPDPNQVYPLLFTSILNNLSAHTGSASQEYSKAQAEELFAADWASAAAFTLDAGIAQHYRNAFLIGIHKHHVADAYSLFIYDEDSDENRERLKRYQNILAFKTPGP